MFYCARYFIYIFILLSVMVLVKIKLNLTIQSFKIRDHLLVQSKHVTKNKNKCLFYNLIKQTFQPIKPNIPVYRILCI